MSVNYCTDDSLRRLGRKLSLAFNGANQLTHEKRQSYIKGDADDLKTMWCLDQEIERLITPFKGVGFISEDVRKKIDGYVSALAPVFRRVSAYQLTEPSPGADLLGNVLSLAGYEQKNPQQALEERKVPVRYLEYYCPFTSQHGGRIEQRVASIRLG